MSRGPGRVRSGRVAVSSETRLSRPGRSEQRALRRSGPEADADDEDEQWHNPKVSTVSVPMPGGDIYRDEREAARRAGVPPEVLQ